MGLLSIPVDTLSPRLTGLVEPYCTAIGTPYLAVHLPLALLSFAFWVGLQFGSAIITPIVYPAYKQLPRRTRIQWHVHFVALIHALVITPLAAAQWYEVRQDGGLIGGSHPLARNRTYGYTREAGNVYAVTLGYFIWDLIVSILYDGPGFIAHGAVAMLAFTFVYHPIFMYDGFGFLLWELSSSFLNAHWFLDKTGRTGSKLQLINAVFLLSTYVFARLTFGVYNSYSWFMHVNFPPRPHVPAIPLGLRLFYSIGNVTLNSLNFIWFRAMIASVQKRFDGSGSSKDSKEGNKAKKAPFSGSYVEQEQADATANKMAGVGPEGREDLRKRVVGSGQ